jgi:hypothetical protein
MSRWTLPYKAGVVMALAAFVIGITAASAMAWPSGGETDKPPAETPKQDKDKEGKGEKDDEDRDKGGHQKPQPQPKPPEVTPPSGAEVPPAPAAPAGPPAPVTAQEAPPAPTAPEQPVEVQAPPAEEEGVPQSPIVAQAAPTEAAPAAAAAERQELARTGLDPALIGLLGALCVGAGGLLFRRALAGR